jgi:CBS domain
MTFASCGKERRPSSHRTDSRSNNDDELSRDRIGVLVVLDTEERLVGIVSERDIVRAMAVGVPFCGRPGTIRVGSSAGALASYRRHARKNAPSSSRCQWGAILGAAFAQPHLSCSALAPIRIRRLATSRRRAGVRENRPSSSTHRHLRALADRLATRETSRCR